MKDAVRLLKFTAVAVATAMLMSCAPKSGGSKLKIVLPSAGSHKTFSQSGSGTVSTLAFNFSVACFGVNVVGPGISSVPNSCSAESGIFSGFFPGGSTVSLSVPQGSDRRVEIFQYDRSSASDPCATDLHSIAANKLAIVGSQSGVDMNAPEVTVSITVTSPAPGVSLISQLSLSPSCSVASGTTGHSAVLGALRGDTANGYKIDSKVTFIKTNAHTTAGGYKMILGPKAR
jgi:hypothetical protein